jgi:hypothetical protein
MVVAANHKQHNSDHLDMTFNGVSMTLVDEVAPGTTRGRVALWYLEGVSTGAQNLVCSWTANAKGGGAAVALSGVDQTTPVGTHSSSASSTFATSCTDTVDATSEDFVVGCVGIEDANNAITATDDMIEDDEGNSSGGTSGRVCNIGHSVGGATKTFGGSWTGNEYWGMVMVPINEAAAAGRTTYNTDPRPLGVNAGVSRRMAS